MMQEAKIGVIGGSGLYEIRGLSEVRRITVDTPFGPLSGPVTLGLLGGVGCAFLPRHGQGHVLLPSEINSRANIWALKSLGVERVVAVSAVGSLAEDIPPRQFVFPDQLVDRTKGRASTFFGGGVVAHVAFDRPFCGGLSGLIAEKARTLGISARSGGAYLCMEGPQFSTKAESALHRSIGCSIIGMTALPEAKLAREAELCYTLAGLVTDYDCWKEGEEVEAARVVETLNANVADAIRLLEVALPAAASQPRTCRCGRALEGAVFTRPDKISAEAAARLGLLIGRFLPKERRVPVA